MYEKLKEEVFKANLELPKHGLVVLTWGNASAIDRKSGVVVIKPSGVEYETMTPDDMVAVDLDGNLVEGRYRPSSDTPTHLVLYREFPGIGGIVHTHSRWATIYAQSRRPVKAYGTTHGDYFYGAVPCTRDMKDNEIENNYEYETGRVITECFKNSDTDPMKIPAVLVANHGPFTWGSDASDAVHNSIILEECAMMAWHTENTLFFDGNTMRDALLNKHFLRKHGKNAYYGQK